MLTTIQHVYIYFKIYTHISWLINTPPLRYSHPKIRPYAVLRAYCPLVSLNKALLNPYFWGGVRLGEIGWFAINIPGLPKTLWNLFFDSQTPKAFRGSKHILAIHHEVFGGFWNTVTIGFAWSNDYETNYLQILFLHQMFCYAGSRMLPHCDTISSPKTQP